MLTLLRASTGVSITELADRVIGREGVPITERSIVHAISALRNYFKIDTRTVYQLMGEVEPDEFTDLPRQRRGRKPKSDGRLVRGADGRAEIVLPHDIYARIGSPEYVRIRVDQRRGIFSLTATTNAYGRGHSRKRDTLVIVATGMLEALRVPQSVNVLRFNCRVANGAIIAYPQYETLPCEQCKGTGVRNHAIQSNH